MPPVDLSAAESTVARFAAAAEPWRSVTDLAAINGEFDAFLASAIALFDEVSAVDAEWHTAMFGGEIPWDEAEWGRVRNLYRDWAEAGRGLLPTLAALEADGRDVVGAVLFRENLNEVKGIMTPDDEFFVGDKLIELRDRAIDADLRGETVEFEEFGD